MKMVTYSKKKGDKTRIVSTKEFRERKKKKKLREREKMSKKGFH